MVNNISEIIKFKKTKINREHITHKPKEKKKVEMQKTKESHKRQKPQKNLDVFEHMPFQSRKSNLFM